LRSASSVERFCDFELDRAAYELRRHGRPVKLEGRAMTLLMLLLERPGELVTRAEIVARLWGTDSFIDVESGINTAVRKLRAALRDHADDPRIVRTVQGKGYRFIARLEPALDAAKPDQPVGAPAAPDRASTIPPADGETTPLRAIAFSEADIPVTPARPKARVYRVAVAGVAAVALVAVAAAGWRVGSARRAPAEEESPQVAVQAFRPLAGGPADAALAARVSDGVLAAFQDAGVRTGAPGDAGPWRLGGTVMREGDVVRARVELADAATKVPVWTAQFERPAGQEEALRAAVGGAASEAIYAAKEATQTAGVNAPPKAVAAFIRGSSALADPNITNLGEPLHAFQEMVALSPGSATAHGYLALSYAFAGAISTQVGADAARLNAAARQEAARSIAMNPAAAGSAYLALAGLDPVERPHDRLHQEAVILDGLSHAPKYPFLRTQECAFLLSVGRAEAAFAQCQQASGMRPLATPTNVANAHAMVQMGHLDWATNYLDHVSPYHPDNLDLKVQLFEIGAFLGPPAATEAKLRRPKMPNVQYWPGLRPMLLLLRARTTGSPKDAEAAVAALRDAARHGQAPRWVVMGAAVLGRLDDAFAATREFPQLDADPSYLFEPATAAMRRDPRFWEVAGRNGLLRYWKVRRVWPDFCSDRTVGVDCAKAARASGAWARVAG
jgi:DNA-binding winged helix-turn-helix (wHTH) protein/TolB-like protein